jgi:hypothetical protein
MEVALKTRFLSVAGGRIAYDDDGGAGKLVVLIPGLGDRCETYRFLRPLLSAAGYRVVTAELLLQLRTPDVQTGRPRGIPRRSGGGAARARPQAGDGGDAVGADR